MSGTQYCHGYCGDSYGDCMLTPICRMLSGLANQVLAEDVQLQAALQPYSGHIIAIEVRGIEVVGYVKIADGHILLDTKLPEGEHITTVNAAPSTYLRVLQDYIRGGALRMQGLRIDGDAALISQLLRIAKSMPIDWESIIASQWGDMTAQFGMRVWRTMSRGLTFAHKATRDNMRDLVHDEWELAPSPWAFSHFSEQVETLRDQVDCLAARIGRLKQRGQSCGE